MSEAENKKEYEMSYFLTADITEGNVDNVTGELNLLITESGGGSVALEIPKIKRLSYPIKKQNEAYFGVAYFNIGAEGLDKIKKALSFHKKILRFLIVNSSARLKLASNKPAVLFQKPTEEKPKTSPESEKSSEMPTQSFDQKLESILKG